MKPQLRWVIWLFLFQAPGIMAGSLTGTLQNGTRGFGVPDTLRIALNLYLPDGQVKVLPRLATVSPEGRFRFDQLEENPQITYEPMVVYRGIKYYGAAVRLSQSQPNAVSNVTIYETTRSDTALTIVRHHVLFSPGEGSVAVKEMVFLENAGDRTYIGKEPTPSGKFRTVTYKIPPGAESLQLGEGTMTCCIEFEEDGFYDTMEIPPGKKQIVFSYLLKSKGGELWFRKPITINTAEIDFISFDPSVRIEGDGLVEKPLPNNKFKRHVLTGLTAGSLATIRLAGLPESPHDLSLIFFGGFLVVFGVGGFLAYRRIAKSAVATSARPSTAEKSTHVDHIILKEKLLREIALLDEAYEAKKIAEDEYRIKRNLLVEELKHLVNS